MRGKVMALFETAQETSLQEIHESGIAISQRSLTETRLWIDLGQEVERVAHFKSNYVI